MAMRIGLTTVVFATVTTTLVLDGHRALWLLIKIVFAIVMSNR